ncbi:MAG: histidine--tRNA ligase [Anaerolineae bacterium]|nr:histidine--tRNA ligase [Anaerolineae bacterium]
MPHLKPRLPRGFRDFLPEAMLKRDYVITTVREVFHRYGFEPLQTPVLELRETLFGKYGEDAEQLIFEAQHGRSDKDPLAMRYDLTVPLARVVAQYENDLKFPFRRYQIAPVWRGERPQRGRYREFYQCDADIVGVGSMAADAELISLLVTVLQRLGFVEVVVKINNRKLLTGMGQYAGVETAQLADLYRSVDKFDKIGADGVAEELRGRGIAPAVVARMMTLLQAQGPGLAALDAAETLMQGSAEAREGIAELRDMAQHMAALNIPPAFYEFDFTMVRGLGYYTGPIFEAVFKGGGMGSISGGGRYDQLIGMFRKESLPTTGISLGIERFIDLMDDLNLYPAHIGGTVVQALVTIFSEDTRAESTRLAAELRAAGLCTELYMAEGKLKLGKQFEYADKKRIPLVVILGSDEIAQGVVKVKRLADASETTVPRADLPAALRHLLPA